MTQASDKISPFLATSAVFHVGLFALAIFGPALLPKRGVNTWGDSAQRSVNVGLQRSLPGGSIPLPSPPVVQPDAKPSDTNTLHPAEVTPKAQTKAPSKPADVKIPERGAKKPAEDEPSPSQSTKAGAPPPPAPTNAIPGRGDGQTALPYGQPGTATFGGDGSFGSKYGWYVRAVNEALGLKWREATLTLPRGAKRTAGLTFVINKNGKTAELKIVDPSGSNQLDNAARRAVQTATFPALPSDYRGSSVDVRFDFEYTR